MQRRKNKELYSHILFPQLERELKQLYFGKNVEANNETSSTGYGDRHVNLLDGYFVIRILKRGKPAGVWRVILKDGSKNGQSSIVMAEQISTSFKPISLNNEEDQLSGTEFNGSLADELPKVLFEIDDKDLLKMITGGLNGIKAYTTKRLRIKGDLQLASDLEKLFVKAGGVEKVMNYVRMNTGKKKNKLAKL